ncbi:hypothetical protein ACHAXH_009562 [Discostella pseudostelligera]
MAMATTRTGPPAPSISSGLPPHHSKASSAPPSASGSGLSSANANAAAAAATEHVAECTYEFLLAAILQWVERDEKRIAEESNRVRMAMQKINIGGNKQSLDSSRASQSQEDGGDGDYDDDASTSKKEDAAAAAAVLAAERSAARIERMGYDVGYRLCERLAQHRPLLGPGSPSPESGATDAADSSATSFGLSNETLGNNPIIMGGGGHNTIMDPKTQLEAVKFLCKEFWTEVFRKQIDKLQTNHRGVFVLKDQELKWLRRLPADEESARVGAIRILAFPCGLIRGALACLGLSGAIVSCDFLADGKTMASCSFNIKVK